MEWPAPRADTGMCRACSSEALHLREGVHDVVLRGHVCLLRTDCRGLELGRNSHGCDAEFLDPAVEWDRIAHDPLVDGTSRSSVLTDHIRHKHLQGGR